MDWSEEVVWQLRPGKIEAVHFEVKPIAVWQDEDNYR